jgi:hypothetical protein
MKVLEPGKVKEKWSIQHRCTGWGRKEEGCEALLEIEFDDLRYQPGCYDEKCESDPVVSFRCPCCAEVTNLGLNDWPKNYRKLKQWNYEWHFNKDDASRIG